MYIAITLLLSAWTFFLATQISYGIWDSIILVCWIGWPLYLVCILIYAKHRSYRLGYWKLRNLGDYLLLGAYLPLVLGIIYFNVQFASNAQNSAVSFAENLFFVGVFSVVHWFVTGLSIFLFYLLSKYFLGMTPKNSQ